MLRLHRLAVVYVHGQIVVLHPLLGNPFELAGNGVFGDFDTGHGHEGFARFELLPLLWS